MGDLRSFAGEATEPAGAVDLIREYESRISGLSFSDVLPDPNLVRTKDWHLDFINSAAKAFVGGHLYNMIQIPAARVLDAAGLVRRAGFRQVRAVLGWQRLDQQVPCAGWPALEARPLTVLIWSKLALED